MTMQTTAAPAVYPFRFDVQYAPQLSRGLIFVKWLLAVPHFIIIGALGYLQSAITIVAWFAILFTGRVPPPLFDFWVKASRWSANTIAYAGLLRDEYPPFGWEAGQYPVVTYDVEYPQQLNRWLVLVKWLLAFPHYVVLAVLYVIAGFAWVVAFFGILFMGQFPRGLFDFVVGVMRWGLRVGVYLALLRDEYPPFTLA
jgi:hypothetical protein